MTQEAYDEVMLNMVLMNLNRVFAGRDAISSKTGMCAMGMTGSHLNVKIGSDYAVSIPYSDIASVEMGVSSERGYGALIVNTKSGYGYSIRLDDNELCDLKG